VANWRIENGVPSDTACPVPNDNNTSLWAVSAEARDRETRRYFVVDALSLAFPPHHRLRADSTTLCAGRGAAHNVVLCGGRRRIPAVPPIGLQAAPLRDQVAHLIGHRLPDSMGRFILGPGDVVTCRQFGVVEVPAGQHGHASEHLADAVRLMAAGGGAHAELKDLCVWAKETGIHDAITTTFSNNPVSASASVHVGRSHSPNVGD
jgi:hypothetical protein